MKRRAISPLPLALSTILAAYLYRRVTRPAHLRAGQVAIITGGSSGLGLALAHRFGRAGLKLVLAARDIDQLDRARRDLLASGAVSSERDVLLFPGDLSERRYAPFLVEAALQTFGGLDLLINNAGIIEVGPVENQPLEAYERAMAVNFFAALYATHAILPHFLRSRSGMIVNISSIGGKFAVPHLLPYVASKFALTGFSEGLHAEVRNKGIRVTTVCPGLMRTGGETHAHFRGQVDREKAWFQTSAQTPILSASAENAAAQIFNAVHHGRAEITITPQAWLAARFSGMAPETTQALCSLVNTYLLPAPVAQLPR